MNNTLNINAIQTESSIVFKNENKDTVTNNSPLKPHQAKIIKRLIRGKNAEGKSVLNQYIVKEKLGEGSFARVRLLYKPITQEKLALKILNKGLLKKKREIFKGPDGKLKIKDAYESAMREIDILKCLDHPNVLKLYEIIDNDDCNKLYLVMDYCEYGQLIDWDEEEIEFYNTHSAQNDFFNEIQLKKIFMDCVCGLQYLHKKNIIHRDLKPQNILMDHSGNMRIADLGSAIDCSKNENDFLYDTQGTYHFMPPEACTKNFKPYSGKMADVWALGVTLYSLIYFKTPFYKDNLIDLFNSIENDELVFLDSRTISDDLKDLLSKLLNKNSNERITLQEILEHKWLENAPSQINILPSNPNNTNINVIPTLRKGVTGKFVVHSDEGGVESLLKKS